jgi:hypothetical protein
LKFESTAHRAVTATEKTTHWRPRGLIKSKNPHSMVKVKDLRMETLPR